MNFIEDDEFTLMGFKACLGIGQLCAISSRSEIERWTDFGHSLRQRGLAYLPGSEKGKGWRIGEPAVQFQRNLTFNYPAKLDH